jgi:outer membrane protein TolC
LRNSLIRTAAKAVGAVCIASAFVVSQTPPGGAVTERFDLSGALQYALDHNPQILAKRAALSNAESLYVQRHAAQFPTIAGTLSQVSNKTVNGGVSTFGLSPTSVFSQNTAQIGSSYTLYNGSYNQITAEQAKRNQESAKADLTFAEEQIAINVTADYYDIVAKREAIGLAISDREYQQALLNVARYSEKVGRSAGVDVLRAEVQELRSEASLATARDAAATASETLAVLIGANAEASFIAPATIPEPALPQQSADSLVAIAENVRPDVVSALDQVRSAKLSDAVIDTNLKPVITLTGAFGNQTTPTQDASLKANIDATNAQINAYNAARPAGTPAQPLQTFSRAQPGFWTIGVNSTFTLPIIEYGARRAEHRAAKSQVDANLALLNITKTQVEVDVRSALRSARTAAVNLDSQRRASEYGAEAARIAQLQYRNGLISLTDVTQAQQTALQSALDLVNARVAYVDAVVRLRTALGTYDPLATVEMQS